MGLNDFVSLFYGSAQNLNTSTPSLTLTSSTDVGIPLTINTNTTLEMLKNHKNSKLPKFSLNDFTTTSDVKFSRNMTLTSMKTPRQKGIILNDNGRGSGGKGGENCDSVGKSGRYVKNAAASASAKHKVHSSSIANAKSSITTALEATTSTTTTSAAVVQSCSSEMDLLKATGLRKKSSFLWNSFRMPRKQKGGESRD